MTDVDNLTLEQRVAGLEQKISLLEKERPGRRIKPNMIKQKGVCGLDPTRDSATCPDASIYRHQNNCRGTLCEKINADYYQKYRAKKRETQAVVIDTDDAPEQKSEQALFTITSRRRPRPRMETTDCPHGFASAVECPTCEPPPHDLASDR